MTVIIKLSSCPSKSPSKFNIVSMERTYEWQNALLVTRVCKSNESESVSVLCYELVFHHKWADAVFHGGCAVFWGGCAVFQGGCTVFCCGTALTYKLCILLLLDYFHPRNDGSVSCLPFTEHVQTLFTLN